MNSTIQHTLHSIENAVKALQEKLVVAQKENEAMLLEVTVLKQKNSDLNAELAVSKEEEKNLLESLEASKKFVENESLTPKVDKDAQIDELVREIEYCISQLTK